MGGVCLTYQVCIRGEKRCRLGWASSKSDPAILLFSKIYIYL